MLIVLLICFGLLFVSMGLLELGKASTRARLRSERTETEEDRNE